MNASVVGHLLAIRYVSELSMINTPRMVAFTSQATQRMKLVRRVPGSFAAEKKARGQ